MSAARIVGVVLIVLGALALIYKGFTYTRSEQVAELGPLEASVEKEENVSVPIWAGIALLGGGVLLLLIRVPATKS